MRTTTGSRSTFVWLACFAAVLLAFSERALATDLSGTYTTTQVITENSRLTGDVTCDVALIQSPCIVFGASDIKLSLNGFTITGPVDALNPAQNPLCSKPPDATFGVGIEATAQSDITIEGPGVIQHFERWGLLVRGTPGGPPSAGNTVRDITATRNCWSGFQVTNVSNSEFVHNVWANNAGGSNGAGCGGLCLTNSSNNRLRKSTFYGNGSVDYSNGNVTFGIGFEGASSGNLVEDNDIGGNSNGLLFFNTSSNNLVRRNIIAGNPAAQVIKTFVLPNQRGADIAFRPTFAGANNVFDDNFCLTYLQGGTSPTTAPCPNIRTPGVEQAANHREIPLRTNRNKPSDGADLFSVAALLLAAAFKKLVIT